MHFIIILVIIITSREIIFAVDTSQMSDSAMKSPNDDMRSAPRDDKTAVKNIRNNNQR